MKLFKYTMVAALSALALGFTACDDDEDFIPGAPSEGVFFSETEPTVVSLETSSTHFDVTVSRAGITEAATYALTSTVTAGGVEVEGGDFFVPVSATFDEGATTSVIRVLVNGANLVTGQQYDVTIALAEGVPGFNYGNSNITIHVTRQAAWGDWEAYGDGLCTYTYETGFILSGDDPDLPLSIRHNTENPDLHQFRIEHWYYNTTLIIDYNSATGLCEIAPQYTGTKVNVGDLGEVDLMYATAYPTFTTSEDFKNANRFYEDEGVFELYVVYCIPYAAYDSGYAMLNGGDGFEYCTVGEYADYSVDVEYNGTLIYDTEMSASFTANVGKDADEALFAVAEGNTQAAAQALLEGMLAGTVATTSVAPGENMAFSIPVASAGEYVVVGYTVKNGEPKTPVADTFTVYGGGGAADPWTDVAVVDIVDGWIHAGFQFKDNSGNVIPYTDLGWQVVGQESTEVPGLYRLKSPWTDPNCPLVQMEGNSNTKPAHIIVDATNPDCVKIPPQYSGFTFSGDGAEFYISNLAGYYLSEISAVPDLTDDDIINAGLNEIWEDGYVYIGTCLFGYDMADEFGYSWKSEPYAEIFFDFSGKGKPAKKNGLGVNLKRLETSARTGYRFPILERSQRPLSISNSLTPIKNALHIVR
ncbi:MAG: hypothetical protein ACI30X_04925 [Muribaculaceae bacterium]